MSPHRALPASLSLLLSVCAMACASAASPGSDAQEANATASQPISAAGLAKQLGLGAQGAVTPASNGRYVISYANGKIYQSGSDPNVSTKVDRI